MIFKVLRWLGFLGLAGGAVAVYIVLAPKIATSTPTLPSATQYESLIATALSDNRLNDLSAASAPQQQVVNGWVARDLLTIVAKEDADILRAQGAVVDTTGNLQTHPFDERVPALLLIAVLALIWGQLTAPRVVSSPMTSKPETPDLAGFAPSPSAKSSE